MNIEYFINNMLEKINRAELNLFISILEESSNIDKNRQDKL